MLSYMGKGGERRGGEREGKWREVKVSFCPPIVSHLPIPFYLLLANFIFSAFPRGIHKWGVGTDLSKVDLVSNTKQSINSVNTLLQTNSIDFSTAEVGFVSPKWNFWGIC